MSASGELRPWTPGVQGRSSPEAVSTGDFRPQTRSLVESKNILKLEFGMYPQSMPTEWTHARTLRRWQSVRLDL